MGHAVDPDRHHSGLVMPSQGSKDSRARRGCPVSRSLQCGYRPGGAVNGSHHERRAPVTGHHMPRIRSWPDPLVPELTGLIESSQYHPGIEAMVPGPAPRSRQLGGIAAEEAQSCSLTAWVRPRSTTLPPMAQGPSALARPAVLDENWNWGDLPANRYVPGYGGHATRVRGYPDHIYGAWAHRADW